MTIRVRYTGEVTARFSKILTFNDQAEYEEWLARVKPAGDAESVQAQWEASSEYAEVHATKEPSDVQ
jgi:hypothetical protein